MLKFHRLMGQVGALALVVLGVGVAARAGRAHASEHSHGFHYRREACAVVCGVGKRFLRQARISGDDSSRARVRRTLCERSAPGGADFGFADMATMIVAKSRGAVVQAAAQFGYVGATILWRDEGVIKSIKDLAGKSLAISPGQAQWYLLPAYCRINKIDFKSIKIQETAAPIQPAALVTKKADFIIMFRASNDEVAEQAASKVGVKLSRAYMKDTGLDIYGSSLIVKDEDVRKRPEFVRAYVEGTLEGLRYARDNQEETLKILLKLKPELDSALTTLQLKNALTEVFLPLESVQVGMGFMKPDIMEKTVRITNEYFDVGRKVAAKEAYTNQFIKR